MNSKFVLGLITGVAVGAAAVYLATGDNKEELMNDIKDLANKTKDKISEQLGMLEKKAAEARSAAGAEARAAADEVGV